MPGCGSPFSACPKDLTPCVYDPHIFWSICSAVLRLCLCLYLPYPTAYLSHTLSAQDLREETPSLTTVPPSRTCMSALGNVHSSLRGCDSVVV